MAREPMQARDNVIYAGPHDYDAAMGEVYKNGQPAPGDVAKLWAGAFDMFPVLAEAGSTLASMAWRSDIPEDVRAELKRLSDKAIEVLPLPCAGESPHPQTKGEV